MYFLQMFSSPQRNPLIDVIKNIEKRFQVCVSVTVCLAHVRYACIRHACAHMCVRVFVGARGRARARACVCVCARARACVCVATYMLFLAVCFRVAHMFYGIIELCSFPLWVPLFWTPQLSLRRPLLTHTHTRARARTHTYTHMHTHSG